VNLEQLETIERLGGSEGYRSWLKSDKFESLVLVPEFDKVATCVTKVNVSMVHSTFDISAFGLHFDCSVFGTGTKGNFKATFYYNDRNDFDQFKAFEYKVVSADPVNKGAVIYFTRNGNSIGQVVVSGNYVGSAYGLGSTIVQ
jgi:hypothetical protein